MSRTKAVFILIAALMLAASEPAWAWRGASVRFGVVIGAPFFPWYYPYPPYYYQPYPIVVVPPAPTTYVEQGGPPPQAPSYWYYCAASRTYYPYVNECPGGWMRVVPHAPPTTQPHSTPPSAPLSKPKSPPQAASAD